MKISGYKIAGKHHVLEILMAVLMLVLVYIFAGKMPALRANTDDNEVKVVVIDPGHGGIDGGAVSVLGDAEKDINLAIGLKLRDMLKKKDIGVIMTRDTDIGLYGDADSNKKVVDMKNRCKLANESGADLLVSIHQNNYQSEGVKGAQVFYYSHSQEGEKAALAIQDKLIENLDKENGRKAKANDNYYILINVECPAVIAECGFLSNYGEAELLKSEEYQEKVADALCQGICEYLGVE
ncbi:MAG: N-acetylmuramoyl-L-alanine amidase [Lachnospiraceae bacterium]